MTNQEIVSKLWNLCNILRDDGITYHQYVTELTYILFLKMAKETKTEDTIPEEYRWDKLVAHSGIELKKFYKELLADYAETGRTFVISTHMIEEAADLFEETIILKDGSLLLKENTQDLLDRAFHISGKAEDVDAACAGLHVYHPESLGRSKGVTVLLEPGQTPPEGFDVSIQPVSLQNLFVALCGKEPQV